MHLGTLKFKKKMNPAFIIFICFCLSVVHNLPMKRITQQWLALHNYNFNKRLNESSLLHWNSPGCRNFYWGTASHSTNRLQQPQIAVLEALHSFGRKQIQKGAQEIVVNHKYKFVYVEVRKAASTSIRRFLKQAFDADFYHGCAATNECLIFNKRCSSLCLNKQILQDYFFFTFVRNPANRFLAAYKQLRGHKKRIESNYTKDMREVLLQLLFNHNTADEHIQTQSFALSATVIHADSGFQIPLDFIGRVENIQSDWPRLLAAIEAHTNKSLPNLPQLKHELQELESERKRIEDAATDAVMKLATLTYAQDYVCLGYDPQPHLIPSFDELMSLLHHKKYLQVFY